MPSGNPSHNGRKDTRTHGVKRWPSAGGGLGDVQRELGFQVSPLGGGGGLLLASGGQRPEMRPQILQCTGHSPTTRSDLAQTSVSAEVEKL